MRQTEMVISYYIYISVCYMQEAGMMLDAMLDIYMGADGPILDRFPDHSPR
jgi:hypothetical protein